MTPLWSWRTQVLPSGSGLRATLFVGEHAASALQVWRAWRDDAAFRAQWADWLRGVPFGACLWETPPATRASLGQAFECVFLPSAALATARPDPEPFAEHFERAPEAEVVVFDSLGRDALLIAPTPTPAARHESEAARAASSDPGDRGSHAHLAVFMRSASARQVDCIWAQVGREALARVGDAPLWISTSGLGVHWLHFRLDSRPKYYHHHAYRQVP